VTSFPKGRLETVSLKDAIEAAQTDLRVLQKESHKGVKLVRPLGMLSGVLSSLPEGGDAPILLAKDACEAIVDCARRAEDEGSADAAERLRGVNRALSPVVAGQYGLLKV
jgi:hypothetical protein